MSRNPCFVQQSEKQKYMQFPEHYPHIPSTVKRRALYCARRAGQHWPRLGSRLPPFQNKIGRSRVCTPLDLRLHTCVPIHAHRQGHQTHVLLCFPLRWFCRCNGKSKMSCQCGNYQMAVVPLRFKLLLATF